MRDSSWSRRPNRWAPHSGSGSPPPRSSRAHVPRPPPSSRGGEGLLAGADQAMVNAFTSGFRVAQTQLAINKALPDTAAAAAALESAQIVALAILVREQLDPAQFQVAYRPFATILPGPGFQPAAPVDRQIAAL